MSALGSVAEVILAGGLAQIGLALWQLAAPAALAAVMFILTAFAVRRELRHSRRVPFPAEREHEDTQPWPVPAAPCPWCGTRECLDSAMCNCAAPCGSWLCTAKEENRA